MMLRRLSTVVIVLALGVTLASSQVASAADPAPAKIGIGLGLTGPLAFLSQEYLKGLRAAVDLVNKEGGVGGGRKLELVERDHKGIPSEAVAVAKRLIEQDRVDIVDIDLPSTVAIAAEAVTKQARTPQLTGFGFPMSVVEQGNPYHFRTCTNAVLIATVLADAIRAMPNNRAIAMLAPNDDYGRGAIKSLTDALSQPGSPKVVFADYYERDQTDFTAVLLKMKSLNPDSLYIDVRFPANVTVLKQMAELAIKKQLFGSVNFYNTKLVERAAPLLEVYQKMYNELPNDSASLGWTTGLIAAAALRMAGPGADGEAIRAALTKVELTAPQGTIKFDQHGDARVPAHVLQFKNGAYQLIK